MPPVPSPQNATSEAETAPYVTDALDRAQMAFEATVNPDTPMAEQKNAIWSYIYHVSVALMHECLTRIVPSHADQVAQWLEGALEDDTAAQWVHEARQAIARGERVPLPFDETRPIQDAILDGPQMTGRAMGDVLYSRHPDTILCVRTPDGLRPISGISTATTVTGPSQVSEVLVIEPEVTA